MRRYASSYVLSGALAAFGASPAFAAGPPCSSMAVAVDAGVRARWPELPGQVRQAFETRTDVDTCARVELALNDGSIAIGVTLPDGRSASRQVLRREDVLSTLEALLLVPRAVPEALVVATSAPSIPASAPTQTVQTTAIPVVPAHMAVPERDEVLTTMQDLAGQGTDILTLGQYLQPTREHLPIVRYVHPDEFAEYKVLGEKMGFKHVEAGPLVRSSYHAFDQAESAHR